jgi:hypothetical protein
LKYTKWTPEIIDFAWKNDKSNGKFGFAKFNINPNKMELVNPTNDNSWYQKIKSLLQ